MPKVPTIIYDDRDRWAEAAPKIAMALCEAGFPCKYLPVSSKNPMVIHIIEYDGIKPPKEVVLKAGELTGVKDLIEMAYK